MFFVGLDNIHKRNVGKRVDVPIAEIKVSTAEKKLEWPLILIVESRKCSDRYREKRGTARYYNLPYHM
jgi:hypothetical protein